MLAYHNDPELKREYLNRVRAHREADELLQGYAYWKDGKGCAVGCTIHGSDHMAYETQLGVPVMLAWLEDCIFEGLPVSDARMWPERFLAAIKPGADLSRVGWKLLYWLQTTPEVNPGINHSSVRDAVQACAAILVPLCNGEMPDGDAAWSAARSAWNAWNAAESAASATRSGRSAWNAADAAWSAAWSAARSAAESAESAASATRSAARSAWNAADAARSAARSAESAASAADAADAAENAESAAWQRTADKLISLLEDAA